MTHSAHRLIGEDRRLHEAGVWLQQLKDNSLTDARLTQWIEWCESDPRNLQAFEQLQSLWQAAAKYPPSEQFVEHLMRSDAPAVRPRRFNAPRWAMAASVVLAVTAAGYWSFALRNSAAQVLAEDGEVRTPTAQNQHATLPDGSKVDLGARSALEVDFTAARRQLQLRDGQAFFQVKHDATRPFVVGAGGVQIVAIGTAFDVRRSSEQVAVTVQEGAVEVTEDGGALKMRAPAGYQLIFEKRTGKMRQSLVDPAVALAWRLGRLEFTGDPLEVVIASVNRYSQRPVRLADPQLGALTFTGTIFVDSIEASLDGLQQVFPVAVTRAGGEIVLTRRSAPPMSD